ncbi:hypothetical protein M405DRAFT_840934 [Rhizopogon salebrosus TDB-379]|nr:hypothetical protein M405DRAFT_840934 [Rhizopogon salebrosus TDB-379]
MPNNIAYISTAIHSIGKNRGGPVAIQTLQYSAFCTSGIRFEEGDYDGNDAKPHIDTNLARKVVRGAMQIDVSLRVVQIVPADHKGLTMPYVGSFCGSFLTPRPWKREDPYGCVISQFHLVASNKAELRTRLFHFVIHASIFSAGPTQVNLKLRLPHGIDDPISKPIPRWLPLGGKWRKQ